MATAPFHRLTAQQVSHAVITAAMQVHTELGPGLLESSYSACLQFELADAGYRCSAQVKLRFRFYIAESSWSSVIEWIWSLKIS